MKFPAVAEKTAKKPRGYFFMPHPVDVETHVFINTERNRRTRI